MLIFGASQGTGGTISGVGTYLKGQNDGIRVVLADPRGSGLFNKASYPISTCDRLELRLSLSQVKHGVMYAPEEQEGKRRRHQVDTVRLPRSPALPSVQRISPPLFPFGLLFRLLKASA
jgi:cysteine synthase A